MDNNTNSHMGHNTPPGNRSRNRRNRNRNKANGPTNPYDASYTSDLSTKAYRWKLDQNNMDAVAANPTSGSRSKLGSWGGQTVPIGPGRPPNDQQRQTLPVDDPKQARPSTHGNVSVQQWPTKEEPNSFIPRRPPFRYSFQNLQWGDQDLLPMQGVMCEISPDMMQAKRLVQNLVNTRFNISIKSYNSDGEAVDEDQKATAIAKKWLERAGEEVVSDYPGFNGGPWYFFDKIIDNDWTWGAMSAEMVLTPSRKDVQTFVPIPPQTIEFRRDEKNPGYKKIGQRRADVRDGWRALNPNLVTWIPSGGDSIYGQSHAISGLQMLPMWLGFFGKLQIFLHRAAFGFLDGVVKMEVLQEMWKTVRPNVKSLYDNNFIEWANAMVEYLAACYKEQGESDPDGMLLHLDLFEVKAEATGKASFPITDTAEALLAQLHLATGTPGEMLGRPSKAGDMFSTVRVLAYKAQLITIQKRLSSMMNRFFVIGFDVIGYGAKVSADCSFDPPPLEEDLTHAQADQLRWLIEKAMRDDNIISQDELSRKFMGRPAIGPAPLSGGADPSGPSAPSVEVMAQRKAASSGDTPGHASGPSFGGKQKGRDTAPNQQKDKKMAEGDLRPVVALKDINDLSWLTS